MEDDKGRIEGQNERSEKEEVFTKVVRAGKRTYFFDVKSTRHEDLYLTITESKKRPGKDGKMFYEKHKIFLYRRILRSSPRGFVRLLLLQAMVQQFTPLLQLRLKNPRRQLLPWRQLNFRMSILTNWGQGNYTRFNLLKPTFIWITYCWHWPSYL